MVMVMVMVRVMVRVMVTVTVKVTVKVMVMVLELVSMFAPNSIPEVGDHQRYAINKASPTLSLPREECKAW
jgi:hypothetical protein